MYGQEVAQANTQSSGRDPRATDVPRKVTARDPAPRISNPRDARLSINLAKAKFYSVWGPEVNRFQASGRARTNRALRRTTPRLLQAHSIPKPL